MLLSVISKIPYHPSLACLTSYIFCKSSQNVPQRPSRHTINSWWLNHLLHPRRTVFFPASVHLSSFFPFPGMSFPPSLLTHAVEWALHSLFPHTPPCTHACTSPVILCAFSQKKHHGGMVLGDEWRSVSHRRDFGVEDVEQLLQEHAFPQ